MRQQDRTSTNEPSNTVKQLDSVRQQLLQRKPSHAAPWHARRILFQVGGTTNYAFEYADRINSATNSSNDAQHAYS